MGKCYQKFQTHDPKNHSVAKTKAHKCCNHLRDHLRDVSNTGPALYHSILILPKKYSKCCHIILSMTVKGPLVCFFAVFDSQDEASMWSESKT